MRMISPGVKSTTGDSNFFVFSDCQRESSFAQLLVSLPPVFNTASFRVGVLAVEIHIRVTHGIAASAGISNSSWRSD